IEKISVKTGDESDVSLTGPLVGSASSTESSSSSSESVCIDPPESLGRQPPGLIALATGSLTIPIATMMATIPMPTNGTGNTIHHISGTQPRSMTASEGLAGFTKQLVCLPAGWLANACRFQF